MKNLKQFFLIICFLLVSSFGYSQSKKMTKFKKEYNTLEYLVKTKTDSLYHVTTQKINKLSFNAKTELNQLEEKYGSSNLKMMLYQKKYSKEISKINSKYQVEITEIQGEHQFELSKIQFKFETEVAKLQMKYEFY